MATHHTLASSATILWRILTDQFVSNDQILTGIAPLCKKADHQFITELKCIHLIPEVLRNQPSTPSLMETWHPVFKTPKSLTDEMALHFINDVWFSLETFDKLFPWDIYTGETLIKKQNPADQITRRARRKRKAWSLHLTIQGQGYYNCIRQQIVSKPGDLILISPEGIYDYQPEATADLWCYQWIYFPQNEQWLHWLNWPEVGPGIYHLQTPVDTLPHLQGLISECIEVFHNNLPYSTDLLKNLTEQVLIRCARFQPASHHKTINPKVLQAMRYITRHFAEGFDLQDLATRVSLSRPRLSALFKEQTGTSIIRWRDEKRMSKACELLVDTTTPINKIAKTVGYSDPLYFSRSFHQRMHCSPREYRRQRLE